MEGGSAGRATEMVTQANAEPGFFPIPRPVLFATSVLLSWLHIRTTWESLKNKTLAQIPAPEF